MLERTLFAALFSVALAALSMDGCKAAQRTASGAHLDKEREIVAAATRCGGQGKVESGPRAEAGKAIAIVAEDLRNGGILGASQGIREAASAIGWTVKVFDLGGMIANRARVMDEVLAFRLFDTGDPDWRMTAHTSFVDPSAVPGSRARESFEIRTLAVLNP